MTRSRLVLGTAGLGMRYGIGTRHAKPTTSEAFAILDDALAGGVNTFDTAQAYGAAEALLGEWISARGLRGRVYVVSKLAADAIGEHSLGRERDLVATAVRKSYERLAATPLDGFLLHSDRDLYSDAVLDGLRRAQQTGLVAHVGASVYDEKDALAALDRDMDFVQVPMNVLDRRLERTGFLAIAGERGTRVFARSPFLQGLLLLEPEQVPPHLEAARPLVSLLGHISLRHGLTRLEAALLFALRGPADHIVFGVETRSQLADVIAAAARPASFGAECLAEIAVACSTTDPAIIDPRRWTGAQA